MDKKTQFFYGFEYWDGTGTTTGEPNKRTGRMSRAGTARAFLTKSARDSWLTGECRSRAGRVPCSKSGLKTLYAGYTCAVFADFLAALQVEAEYGF
jgi:hypothetical protein